VNADNPPAVPAVSLGKSDKPGPPAVRASDADRDRIADILREALAEGRLDAEEHAERVEAVYRSKTVGELEPLIRDLPAGQERSAQARVPAQRPSPSPSAVSAPGGPAAGRGHGHGLHVTGGKNVVAVLSGAVRQGRWRVGGKINAVAVCGGVELDLTEAIFEQPYVEIYATAVCGGVEIKVPENVSLRGSGSGVMGGFEVMESESAQPNAPVVEIKGVAICGGVEAKPVPGKRVHDLRED
jgi:hypothetical protein